MAGTYNKPLFEDSSSFLNETDSIDEIFKHSDYGQRLRDYANAKFGVQKPRRLSEVWKPTGNTPPHHFDIEFTRRHSSDSSLEIIDKEPAKEDERPNIPGTSDSVHAVDVNKLLKPQGQANHHELPDIGEVVQWLETPSPSPQQLAVNQIVQNSLDKASNKNQMENVQSNGCKSSNFKPPDTSTPLVFNKEKASAQWRPSLVPTPIHSHGESQTERPIIVQPVLSSPQPGTSNAQPYFREKVSEMVAIQAKKSNTPSRIPINPSAVKTPRYVPIQTQNNLISTPTHQAKPDDGQNQPVKTDTKQSCLTVNINCNVEPANSHTVQKTIEKEPVTENGKTVEQIVHSTTNGHSESINLITDDEDDSVGQKSAAVKPAENYQLPQSPRTSHSNALNNRSLRRQLFNSRTTQPNSSSGDERDNIPGTPSKRVSSRLRERTTSQPSPSKTHVDSYKSSRPRSRNFYETNENSIKSKTDVSGKTGEINNHTYDVVKDTNVASQLHSTLVMTEIQVPNQHVSSCPPSPISGSNDSFDTAGDLPSDAILKSLSVHVSANQVIENVAAAEGGDDNSPSSIVTDDQSNVSNKENASNTRQLIASDDNMKRLTVRLVRMRSDTFGGQSSVSNVREDCSYANVIAPLQFRDEDVIEENSPTRMKAAYDHLLSTIQLQQSKSSGTQTRRKRNTRKKTNPDLEQCEAHLDEWRKNQSKLKSLNGKRYTRKLYSKGHSDAADSSNESDSSSSPQSQKQAQKSMNKSSSKNTKQLRSNSQVKSQVETRSDDQPNERTASDQRNETSQNQANESAQDPSNKTSQSQPNDSAQNQSKQLAQNQTNELTNNNQPDDEHLNPATKVLREISVQTGDSINQTIPQNSGVVVDNNEIYIPETQELPITEEPHEMEQVQTSNPTEVDGNPKKGKTGPKNKRQRRVENNNVIPMVDEHQQDDPNEPRRSARDRGLLTGWSLECLKRKGQIRDVLLQKPAATKKNNATKTDVSRKTQAAQNKSKIYENAHHHKVPSEQPTKTRGRQRKESREAQNSNDVAEDAHHQADDVLDEQPAKTRRRPRKASTNEPAKSRNTKRKTSVDTQECVDEPVEKSKKSNKTSKSKDKSNTEKRKSILCDSTSMIEMSSDDEAWFNRLLDPEYDVNAANSKRTEPDLHLYSVDNRQIEKTQFSALRFHDINGVQLGFFPSSEEQRNFGILRFLPHSKKPKTSNDSMMLFLILTGKFKFKFGRKSQEIQGGMVKVPAGEQFEIISISDEVGIIQFLMIDNPNSL